jgi:transcriptional regulator with GAF, ATPase, and Fis domain
MNMPARCHLLRLLKKTLRQHWCHSVLISAVSIGFKRASSKPAARCDAVADIRADAQLEAIDDFELLERERIKQALSQTQWRAALAAPLLGISCAALYRSIARFKIVAPHRL